MEIDYQAHIKHCAETISKTYKIPFKEALSRMGYKEVMGYYIESKNTTNKTKGGIDERRIRLDGR
ncbi:MAG: hypothetical protein PQJ59_16875 [Spirochaetales bacterium]|nr:hypothetical protein [Spirochaetales bacterium]